MRQRRGKAVPVHPGFVWRAALLIAPVVVLAVFGVFSLLQDKKLVETEVRERARGFANEAAARCWNQLASTPANASDSLQVDTNSEAKRSFFITPEGGLSSPADYAKVPRPQPVEFPGGGADETALRQFLETNTVERLAVLAHFRLGSLLRQDRPEAALAEFHLVLNGDPDAVGETGLPLSAIAALAWTDMQPMPDLTSSLETRAFIESIASNVLARPSILTPRVLERLTARTGEHSSAPSPHWLDRWRRDEENREAFHAATRHLTLANISGWPEMFWYSEARMPSEEISGEGSRSGDPAWLATRLPMVENGPLLILCRSFDDIRQRLEEVGDGEGVLPAYLGVVYRISGREFLGPRARSFLSLNPPPGSVHATALGSIPPEQVLATAMRTTAEGSEAVSVAVVLLDPDALYTHQRQRLMWFGALIGVSGLVAVIGLVSTWAGIRRQERLYEMQGNFVSSVTHELRAPIGAIRLMAENFQGGKVSEPVEQKRFFGYMVQECRRLSSMIENVLSLARMEQGRSVHEFEPTDVTRLVEDTAQLLQGSANERGVTLHLDIDRAGLSALPCAAVLDGRAVQQALINLIDNALKHSRAGSTVTLGAALAGTVPSRLRLWVADQGTGIPKEDQERVFERFYRRGSELRRETVGIGIGLSLVKHTAEAHGGVVTIESDVGRGSCFTLELPLTAPGTGSPGLPS